MPLSEFYVDKRASDGRYSSCKKCTNKRSLDYAKTPIAVEKKRLRNNSPKIKSKRKEYEKTRRGGGYYEKPEIKASREKYFSNPKVIENRNKQRRKKRAIDHKYRLRMNVSCSIWQSLKRSGSNKSNTHWEKLVGYSLSDLKKHLEKLFIPGMSWDNYGDWHIDHIIPVSKFNFSDPSHLDFKRCWSLKNLRPLWALDNLRKNNKIEKPFQPMLQL
jgi:hypothetical protein